MKVARVEYAHSESALCRSGRLNALIHEPNLSIVVEKVLKPNPRDLTASGAAEQREEWRLDRPQAEISFHRPKARVV